MADTYTTNLNLTKPEPGAAEDTWGISLNADLDALDAIFSTSGTQINLNPNQINFADGKKAVFNSNLNIFSTGTSSYIEEVGTGDLYLKASNLYITDRENNQFMSMIDNGTGGTLSLKHLGSTVLTTTSSGIDITGTVKGDGLIINGGATSPTHLINGSRAGTLVSIDNESTSTSNGLLLNTASTNANSNILQVTSNDLNRFKVSGNGDISFYDDTGTSQNLKWDASADTLNFVDNAKAQFGAGNDLQIYHTGSHSYIDSYTGNLYINSDSLQLTSKTGGENYIRAFLNGAVDIYYDNAVKLATTSSGIDVTGTVTSDGLTVNLGSTGTVATFTGAASNRPFTLKNYDAGISGSGYIFDAESSFGAIKLQTTSKDRLTINNGGDISFYDDTGSSQALFWDASAEALGIGDTSPSGKLSIKGSTATSEKSHITFENTQGSKVFAIGGGASGVTNNNLYIRNVTDNTTPMVITDAGNATFAGTITGDGLTVAGSNANLILGTTGNDITFTRNSDNYIHATGGTSSNIIINPQNRFVVNTGGSETARFTNGNLLVGTTSTNPQDGDHGFVARANGYTLTSVDNARAMLVNRASSDGDIISLAKAGTIFGNIGVIHGNNLFIGGTSHSGLQFGGSIIYPTGGTGSANDATVDLGGSATRFKNLHLSGNAYIGSSAYAQYFGSSADTNTLIQFAGSDDIRFRAGGTEQMRIKTTGVGINTTSPSSALEVNNVSAGATVATFEGNYSGSGDVKLASFERVGGAVAAAMEYNDATTDMEFGTTTSHNFSLKTADTRRLTISSGGNVGIGTASPSHKLDIAAGDIGLDSGRTLYLGSDSNVSINSTSSSRVMRFYTGGSERARINSSGHLLVGTTNSSNTVTGFRAYSGGNIGIAINGQSAEFNRLNNNGNILEFKKDGTNIGYIGSEGGNTLYIVNDDTGIRFAGGSDVIVPCGASGASSDNLISLGLSVLRFKDLHLGGTANVGETLSMSHTGNTSTITLTQKAGTQNSVATISANREDTSSSASRLLFSTNNGTSTLQRIRINNGGDISFYEDTGTTQAFFWDASSESLGIGDTAPQDYLEINGSGKGLGGLTISNSTHNHAALSFARSSTATARIYLNEPDATHTGQLNFQTSNASGGSPNLVTAMVIDENQRVGIGTTAPTSPLHVSGAAKVTGTITVGASHTLGDVGQTDDFIIQSSENNNLILKAGVDSDSLILKTTNTALTINPEGKITIEEETTIDDDINLSLSGSVKGKVGVSGSQGDDIYIASGATSSAGFGLRFIDYNVTEAALPCRGDGSTADNLMDLGNSGSRFDDIYATNGTINTSDKNEKQDIQALTEAEQRVATACKGLIRRFRWQDAVEKKGDDARYHFGVIAQDLQDAFEAEGLDAGDYGMFISSTWTDDEGNEQTRLGVRYNELLAFIITTL